MKYTLIGQDIHPALSNFKALNVYQIEGALSPVYIRQKSMDYMIMNEVFGHECYDAEMKKSPHYNNYRRRFTVPFPKNIVDVGAHIGLTSIYYSLHYPKAKIIAVEPEKNNYQLLLKNTAAYQNIIPLNGAVSNAKPIYISVKKAFMQKITIWKAGNITLQNARLILKIK